MVIRTRLEPGKVTGGLPSSALFHFRAIVISPRFANPKFWFNVFAPLFMLERHSAQSSRAPELTLNVLGFECDTHSRAL